MNWFQRKKGREQEMFKNPEIITVYMDEQRVGRIGLGKNYLAIFEYDPLFVSKGFSISPFFLPLRSGVFHAKRDPFNGLFGVFSDSLPDAWGNLLLDRYLKSIGIETNYLNALGRLSFIGSSGLGALSYQPHFQENNDTYIPNINEYAKEVQKILGEKEYADNIEELYQLGGSSGGARPKVMININQEPWIIKFPSHLDASDYGTLEFQYSVIAKKCGIDMPETRLFEEQFFGVKRFDYSNGKRIHMLSAAGLLNADFRYPSLDYKDLLLACNAVTKNMEEVYKLYRQMVFNVLTGNKDDHAKNFSFLYENKNWRLSPAYDLVANVGFNGQHTTTIAGQGNPKLKEILLVAEQSSIPKKKAQEIFDEVFYNCEEIRIDRF